MENRGRTKYSNYTDWTNHADYEALESVIRKICAIAFIRSERIFADLRESSGPKTKGPRSPRARPLCFLSAWERRSRRVEVHQELGVGLELLELRRQQLHRLDRVHVHEDLAQDPDALELVGVHEQLF